jgi:hypothetical protein
VFDRHHQRLLEYSEILSESPQPFFTLLHEVHFKDLLNALFCRSWKACIVTKTNTLRQLKLQEFCEERLKTQAVGYIDNCLVLWIHHPDPIVNQQNLLAFKESINSYGKLTWEFTHLTKTVNFLDFTIVITKTGILTRLFEKELKNLYFYIPPYSAHSPGVLCGLIIGKTL